MSKNFQEKDVTNTLSNIIPPAELLVDKGIKTSKTNKKQTKDSQKLPSIRMRKLYNVLIRWDDARIIEYLKSLKRCLLNNCAAFSTFSEIP